MNKACALFYSPELPIAFKIEAYQRSYWLLAHKQTNSISCLPWPINTPIEYWFVACWRCHASLALARIKRSGKIISRWPIYIMVPLKIRVDDVRGMTRQKISDTRKRELCAVWSRDSSRLSGSHRKQEQCLSLYVPRLRKKMNYVLEEDQVMMRLTNINRYHCRENSCA